MTMTVDRLATDATVVTTGADAPTDPMLAFDTDGVALTLIERAFEWLKLYGVIKLDGAVADAQVPYIAAEPAIDIVLRAIAIQAGRELRAMDPATKRPFPKAFVQTYKSTSEQIERATTPALLEVGVYGILNGLKALRAVLVAAH